MPSLITEKDLAAVRNPGFCYLCGKDFAVGDRINRDHVPSKALFAKPDRSPPLILMAHEACNTAEKDYDEQIGQLVSVLHRKPERREQVRKLKLGMGKIGTSHVPAGLLVDFPFGRIVARWLKGFHAALYREPLPGNTPYKVSGPFPESNIAHGMRPIEAVHPAFVAVIKKNRLTKSLDVIECNNGKCRYECVWSHLDDGRDICVFALDIYRWSQLGDIHHAPERSSVGSYMPEAGTPLNASRETSLDFPFPNAHPFKAFEF
jgi:hypothetical protein